MYDWLSFFKDGEERLCDVRFLLAYTFFVLMHMPTNATSSGVVLRRPSRSEGRGCRLERERKMLPRGILMHFASYGSC